MTAKMAAMWKMPGTEFLRCTTIKNIVNNNSSNKLKNLNFSNSALRSCSTKPEADANPETEIDKLRNVSRMKPKLRRILRGENMQLKDSPAPNFWWVTPAKLRAVRGRYFGKYGVESGVDPGTLWPTNEDLEKIKARENEFFPTLQVMMANVKKEKEEMAEKMRLRKLEIETNMQKLDGWIKGLENRQQKKLDEVRAKQEKREKLMEEVRAHFGYVVDPKDEKFQDLLAEKEKEEKIAKKEAKKKEFVARELAKMQAISEKALKKKEEKEKMKENEEIKESATNK